MILFVQAEGMDENGNLWEWEGKKRKKYRGKHASCFSHVHSWISLLAVWSRLSAAVRSTLRPPAVADTLATITVFVLLLFWVCKCVLWISCSVLPAEAFSVRSGNPAPQRWHSRDYQGNINLTCVRSNICISHHPAALPQLWAKLFRASLKSELVYIFRSCILRYAKRKEGQRGIWSWRTSAGVRVSSVCMLGSCI